MGRSSIVALAMSVSFAFAATAGAGPLKTPVTLIYGGKSSTTDSFEVVSKLPPCALQPFTSAEMRGKLGSKLVPKAGEKPTILKVPTPPGKPPLKFPFFKDEQLEVAYPDGKRISFTTYLTLLNKYEQLVCDLGLSMRVQDSYEKVTILPRMIMAPVLLGLKPKPLTPDLVRTAPGTDLGSSPPLPTPQPCTPEERALFVEKSQQGFANAFKIENVPRSLAKRWYFVTDSGVCFIEAIPFGNPQLCGIDPENGTNTCHTPEETQSTFPGTVAGNGASLLPCLYSGNMEGSWHGAETCLGGQSGGNGWFGFDLCTTFDSDLSFADAESRFHVGLKQKIAAKATLFGQSIDLVSATATGERDYAQGSGWTSEPAPQREVRVLGLPVGESVSQDISGPSALFLVGPVPVTISSGLTLGAAVGPPSLGTTLPGLSCAAGSEGAVDLGLAPSVTAAAWVKAGVDVLVLEVSVLGKLILAEDTLTASTPVAIRPAKNEVAVHPAVTIDYRHLAGALYLVFDLDFLVVSETFKVELFAFNGITGSKTLDLPEINFASF